MITHLLQVNRRIFPVRRSRAAVGGLVVLIAAVPVAEILVLRIFSGLIVDGPARYEQDPAEVLVSIGVFLLAFVATRVVQHLAKVGRVRVFRQGFEASGATRTPSQESWEWALAFELSGVLASLVQIATFAILFLILDWPTGSINLGIAVVVLSLVWSIYGRQLGLQRDYALMGSKPGTTAISQRVGKRIRDAELGSVLASAGMFLVLCWVLFRTLTGEIVTADAIVFFLGLRLMYGQLGLLSAGIMRFARALARQSDG